MVARAVTLSRPNPQTERAMIAALFPTIEPLPAGYPHPTTLRALERHGLELHELDDWRRIARSGRGSDWAQAAEIVRRSRGG